MKNKRATRGMTLLEAVFSVLVLATGVVAVFGMLGRISSANRSMAFQTASLDAFAQVSAQIRDARCNYPASNPIFTAAETDPGLVVALTNNWTGLVANSAIDHVGQLSGVPKLLVEYRGTQDVVAPGAPISLSLRVRVREVMNDAAKDAAALESGYWIQVFPLKKVCAARPDATGRGEYP